MKGKICLKDIMCYISLDQFASIHFGTRCDFLLFINCDRFLVVIVVYFAK